VHDVARSVLHATTLQIATRASRFRTTDTPFSALDPLPNAGLNTCTTIRNAFASNRVGRLLKSRSSGWREFYASRKKCDGSDNRPGDLEPPT